VQVGLSSTSRTTASSSKTENRAGPTARADALLPLLYPELRKLAGALMARLPPGQTLQPTALVHEAFEKLVVRGDPGWNSEGHFFAAAAQAMRELIVDNHRRKAALKRGGDQRRVTFDEAIDLAEPDFDGVDVVMLHEALEALAVRHPRKAQTVVMRYFGGLSEQETAEGLGVACRTVERDFRFARAWLHKELTKRQAL
jgi:RNA polymerase sigma factor (TIGR02999 family)